MKDMLKDSAARSFFESRGVDVKAIINQPQKYRRDSDTTKTSSTDSARFKSFATIPLSPVFKEFEDVFKKS